MSLSFILDRFQTYTNYVLSRSWYCSVALKYQFLLHQSTNSTKQVKARCVDAQKSKEKCKNFFPIQIVAPHSR